MDNPSVLLECYGGPLDGETVKVETACEVVHWQGHVYRAFHDEDGTRFLRYVGREHVAA